MPVCTTQVALEDALRAAEYERCRAEALLGRLTAAEEEVASLGQASRGE